VTAAGSPVLDALREPVVLAPMAGGPSSPALVAAVSDAGGLGMLGGGYLAPDALAAQLDGLRELTGAPVGVNLFVPGGPPGAGGEPVAAYLEELRPEARRAGVELGAPRADDDAWAEKLALLARARVAVVSFTFGCPEPEVLAGVAGAGSEPWVTVTSPEEAARARDAGARALVLQGAEAGGHRGTFDDHDESDLGLLALIRLVAREVDVPLVAAGGIADGAGIAAVLAAGARAAQLGSAFLRAAEAGTHPAHEEALVEGGRTAITRAFTGRRARGLVNRFMREHPGAPSGYPQIHHVTAPLRAAARAAGDAGGFNLWAGQAHTLARPAPAGDIVRELGAEARAALRRAGERWG
jgi:nitronate monooxygenase